MTIILCPDAVGRAGLDVGEEAVDYTLYVMVFVLSVHVQSVVLRKYSQWCH